jgi:signal peptidase I
MGRDMIATLDADTALAEPRGRSRRRPGRRLRRIGFLLCFIAIAVAAFVALAPTSVGGSDTYLETNGISMLPVIHGGSAVIARKESTYKVGQIVAYDNIDLHTVVLHRIIGRDGAKYIFKGDNNKFPDIFEPTKDQLLGKKVVYWPAGGRLLLNLRTPWVAAVLIGLFAMWFVSDLGDDVEGGRRRRRRRHAQKSA